MAIINKSNRKILLREVRQILETTVQVQDGWTKKRKSQGYNSYPSMVEVMSEKNYDNYDVIDRHASDIKYTVQTTSWLKGVKVRNGATRITIMFDTGKFKNIVVKVPYGTAYDYCKKEVENYQKAPNEIKPFLAQAEFLGNVAVHSYTTSKTVILPVYIMRRVEGSDKISNAYDGRKNPFKEKLSNDEYDKVYYAYARCRSEWVMDLLYERMGIENFLKFLDYIQENYINDLHSGNIGSLGGHPVLFDYAGFLDESDDDDYDYDNGYDSEYDSYIAREAYNAYQNQNHNSACSFSALY